MPKSSAGLEHDFNHIGCRTTKKDERQSPPPQEVNSLRSTEQEADKQGSHRSLGSNGVLDILHYSRDLEVQAK